MSERLGTKRDEELKAAAYEQGYEDGVDHERVRIAKDLGRLPDNERLAYVRGFVAGYHLTCPTSPAVGKDER